MEKLHLHAKILRLKEDLQTKNASVGRALRCRFAFRCAKFAAI